MTDGYAQESASAGWQGLPLLLNGSLWWGLLGLFGIIGLLSWIKTADTSQPEHGLRPNILLLLADDLGVNDVGYNGNPEARTPNIDELAASGMRFTRHYADTTCSPSRVSILTGRYAQRSGFRHDGSKIPDEYLTLAEYLKQQGYHTELTGKWHAGERFRSGWPLQKGFDHWFGFLNQWQLATAVPHDHPKHLRPTYRNPYLRSDNQPPQQHTGHLTDLLLTNTLQAIEGNADKSQPWFLMHAFFAPHTPIDPHERFAQQFAATPEGRYRALVLQLDSAVGDILAKLDETGQRENTVVIFLSDNGGTNTEVNNNFPFVGAKSGNQEGSFRTPLIFSWHEKIASGRQQNEIVMNTDIYPTIQELLEGKTDETLDGNSLLGLLLGSGERVVPEPRLWEDYSWVVDAFSTSYLDTVSNWRYSSSWGFPAAGVDLSLDYTGAENAFADSAALYRHYSPLFYRELERLSLLYQDDWSESSESREIPGFAAERTPGVGNFTLGLGVTVQPVAPGSELDVVLAEQAEIWQLTFTKEGRLVLSLLDKSITGPIVSENRCQEIILSSVNPGMLAREQAATRMKLFVNRQLVATVDVPTPQFKDEHIQRPLRFPHSPVHSLGKVMLSNISRSAGNEPVNVSLPNPAMLRLIKRKRRNDALFYPSIKELAWQACRPTDGHLSYTESRGEWNG